MSGKRVQLSRAKLVYIRGATRHTQSMVNFSEKGMEKFARFDTSGSRTEEVICKGPRKFPSAKRSGTRCKEGVLDTTLIKTKGASL